MGRKQSAQLNLVLPDDDPVDAPSEPPAPARSRAKAAPRPSFGARVRTVLVWTGAGLGLAAAIAGLYKVDQFLASDARFVLPGTPDTKPNPYFSVEGVARTPEPEVMQVFARDFGRSVYLIPLSERRRRLMAIDWVRDARVLRHWPNRVSVRIVERTPVAFAVLPGTPVNGLSVSQTALIDIEGALLRTPPRARFSLPALTGIAASQSAEARRARVRRAMDLLQEIQPYARQISEIDASDPDNIVMLMTAHARAVRLMLGNRRYLLRLGNFLNHYADIAHRLPNARTFDLRLDDHITAQDGGTDGR